MAEGEFVEKLLAEGAKVGRELGEGRFAEADRAGNAMNVEVLGDRLIEDA